MSKNVAMFVDVANMYYAARGQDVDVDYVALLKHATKGRDLIRAYAYTGLDPENENQRKFIDFLGKNGYKPVIKDIRKFGDGRMKANLDIELVVDLFRLADRMDIAVIVSGDGDFAPAIKALQDKGVRCEVISFKPNTSSDLVAVADEFMDIMKIASISRKEGRALRDSMSAPEMPAKEVSPEFGFREASPSVAAAALAAIKGGGSEPARRGRSTTRRTPAATSDEAAPKPVAAPAATADAPADADPERRRRRRRGGRGRGRSRRDDETTAAEPAGNGDVGWEEFDDLSQIDGAPEDREYTFEEVDAETLAELGLSPEELESLQKAGGTDAAAADDQAKPKSTRRRSPRTKKDDESGTDAAAADDEAKPKSTRRRSPRTKKDDESGTDAAAADDEAKPKSTRRRSPRTKKDDESGTDAAAADDEAKPKSTRRRSPRTKKDDESGTSAETSNAAPTGEDGEPQGIWGRFRSARRPRGAGDA
ncbi:MAG: NYN domain-containing protein [Chloroflexi bacterium]|nr:NYN domain-containing protein [Chloroflexota bacterium]